jgi:hypothetical protein
VTIVNRGNIAATGVVYKDLLADPNLTLEVGSVQADPPPPATTIDIGNGVGDTTVQVTIGEIAGGGGSVTISYKARIAATLPAGVTQVANQGIVESNELLDEPTDDPDTPPDDDPTVTPMTAAPVGGITLPLHVHALFAPWIRLAALFGLILASAAVIVWRWRATSS